MQVGGASNVFSQSGFSPEYGLGSQSQAGASVTGGAERLLPVSESALSPVQLARRQIKKQKTALNHLLREYNYNPSSNLSRDVLSQHSGLYGDAIRHCHFAPINTLLDQGCASVEEYDAKLLAVVKDHSWGTSHSSRSLGLARLIGFMASDQCKLKALDQCAANLAGEDLVYIAIHAGPRVADLILQRYIRRLSAESIAVISRTHPEIVAPRVLEGKCLTDENEWPQLVEVCRWNEQLACALFCGSPSRPWLKLRHKAMLALAQPEALGEFAYRELQDSLRASTRPGLNVDEQVAWRLMMSQRELAEQWVAMDHQLFPDDCLPVMWAEVLSRHPGRFDSVAPFDAIFAHPAAVRVLLNRRLSFYLGRALPYIDQHIPDDHRAELVRLYPHLAMLLLPKAGELDAPVSARLVNEASSSSGSQLIENCLERMTDRVREDLATGLVHPVALAAIRRQTNQWQLNQRSRPYPETAAGLENPELLTQSPLRLQRSYPSLLCRRMDLQKNHPELAVAQELVVSSCFYSEDLALKVMRSPLYDTAKKLTAASYHENTARRLLENPEAYLSRPEILRNPAVLGDILILPYQKHVAVEALNRGWLIDFNGEALFALCHAHPEFAVALLDHPVMAERMRRIHFLQLSISNPAFYGTLIQSPALSGLWEVLNAGRKFETDVLKGVTGSPFYNRGKIPQPACREFDGASAQVFLRQADALMNTDIRPSQVECRQFAQGEILGPQQGRLRMGGVCSGLVLDYYLWQCLHPADHPCDYLVKLKPYARKDGDLETHHRSLPERVDYFQRQHGRFLADGKIISRVQEGRAVIESSTLQAMLKQHQMLYLAQEDHCLLIGLWDTPESVDGQQVVVYDPSVGVFCFVGAIEGEPWNERLADQVNEALLNGLLRLGVAVNIEARPIKGELLAALLVTSAKYHQITPLQQ